MLNGKSILITGGTGSFGNAVLKKLLDLDLKEIRIFSRDEKKQDDMRKRINESRVKFYIGDVRNINSVLNASRGVDFIFHAAALKQVPSCEFFPLEAVNTNVHGAENVIESAITNNVKKVVVLSTDKAVYPINAMGMSKALMEKVMVARSRNINDNSTVLCGTRYGNVMSTRGSVIPLFVEQIKNGQPLTITDPNMTRYMMTIDDSIDLVLYAFKHGNQGDIFVQKSPAVTIRDLAQALKELYKADNEIKIIGTRHGEKLYETLASKEELVTAEDMGGFYRIRMDTRDLNYEKYFTEGNEQEVSYEDYHSHNTEQLNVAKVKELLLTLPEVRYELGMEVSE